MSLIERAKRFESRPIGAGDAALTVTERDGYLEFRVDSDEVNRSILLVSNVANCDAAELEWMFSTVSAGAHEWFN